MGADFDKLRLISNESLGKAQNCQTVQSQHKTGYVVIHSSTRHWRDIHNIIIKRLTLL